MLNLKGMVRVVLTFLCIIALVEQGGMLKVTQ